MLNKVKTSSKLPYIIVFSIMTVFFLSTPVFCASQLKNVKDLVLAMLKSIYTMGSKSGVVEVMESVNNNYDELRPALQSIANVIAPISYSVIGVYFVTGFVALISHTEGITYEMLIRPCLYTICAVAAVQFMTSQSVSIFLVSIFGDSFGVNKNEPFWKILVDVFTSLANYFSNMVTFGSPDNAEMTRAFRKIVVKITTVPDGLGQCLRLLLPWLLSKIAVIVQKVIGYAAVLELLVRSMLLPLSFGDVAMNGMSSSGFRYLKALFACGLQMALIVLVGVMCGILAGSTINLTGDAGEFVTSSMQVIVYQVAGILLMRKASQIARDAVGV